MAIPFILGGAALAGVVVYLMSDDDSSSSSSSSSRSEEEIEREAEKKRRAEKRKLKEQFALQQRELAEGWIKSLFSEYDIPSTLSERQAIAKKLCEKKETPWGDLAAILGGPVSMAVSTMEQPHKEKMASEAQKFFSGMLERSRQRQALVEEKQRHELELKEMNALYAELKGDMHG